MKSPLLCAGSALLLISLLPGTSHAQTSREAATVDMAARVLQENISIPMRGIPQALLTNAQAIAIVPDVVKLGFVLAGRRGHGVLMVRNPDGSWSNPVLITLTGGSIGWQAGVQATDVILVFKSRKSVSHVLNGQFTLGADAAVAAGPVGRQAAAATDVELKAEIYSYSRSRGLFAGVALDGSVLSVDAGATAALYGTLGIGPHDVLAGNALRVPANVVALQELLARHAPPAPGPVVWVDPAAVPTPAADGDLLREQLAAAWQQLSPRLDAGWQSYLALPAEIYANGLPPGEAPLRDTLKRYETAASDPQYAALAQMPEFQAVLGRLQAYTASLKPTVPPRTSSRITLPPPPSVGTAKNY